ncbi:MAG: thioredoxin [Bacteroides sp.]
MEKFQELIQSPVPVLVDFFAEWCGPCKAMKPILEEVKTKLGDKVRIAKIDVDQHEDLAKRFRIQTVPTLILFKDGESIWRHSGIIPAKELSGVMEMYIKKEE